MWLNDLASRPIASPDSAVALAPSWPDPKWLTAASIRRRRSVIYTDTVQHRSDRKGTTHSNGRTGNWGGPAEGFNTHTLDANLRTTIGPRGGKRKRRCPMIVSRSEEHTSELQSLRHLVCRL